MFCREGRKYAQIPGPRSQILGPVPVASPSPGQRHCRNSPSQAHTSISRTLWPSCTIAINLNRKLCVVWVERRRYRDDDMGWQWARWSHGLCKICTAFGAAQRAPAPHRRPGHLKLTQRHKAHYDDQLDYGQKGNSVGQLDTKQ